MRTSLVVLFVTAAALAGCSGDKSSSEPPPFVHDEDTGFIHGVVVDSAIRPVADAKVVLRETGDETRTAADGSFGFSLLPPGAYTIEVSKVAFTSARQLVEVVAGEASPPAVRILIEADPTNVPSFFVHPFTGFIECSLRARAPGVGSAGLGPCSGATVAGVYTGPIGNDQPQVTIPFEGIPDLLQVELEWTSTQDTGTGLSVYVGPPLEEGSTFCQDVVWGQAMGTSPLIVSLNRTVLESYRDEGSEQGVCVRVFAWTAPETAETLGVAFSQEFQVYASMFHNFLPEEGWTFITNGEPQPPS